MKKSRGLKPDYMKQIPTLNIKSMLKDMNICENCAGRTDKIYSAEEALGLFGVFFDNLGRYIDFRLLEKDINKVSKKYKKSQ